MTIRIQDIKNKLKSLNITLWEYNEHTPTKKLLRHHKIARYIVYTCIFTSVGMASSVAEILILGGNKLVIIFAIACATVSLLLSIPAIFYIPVLSEIERTLKAQGHHLPTKYSIDERIPTWALKMMFWFFVAVFVPWLLKDNFTTQIKCLLIFLTVIIAFYLLFRIIRAIRRRMGRGTSIK